MSWILPCQQQVSALLTTDFVPELSSKAAYLNLICINWSYLQAEEFSEYRK